MDEVVKCIKACLRTEDGVLSLQQLNRDYQRREFEEIPYRKLGFPSLEAFIEQIPEIRRFNRADGIYIRVVSDEKTAHLEEMIREQKPPKKKRSTVRLDTSTTQVQNTPPYKPPSKESAMHFGEPKDYAPKLPQQPSSSVQPPQTRLDLQQRLQQAQNHHHQTCKNPSPIPENPVPNNNHQVRENLNITTTQNIVPTPLNTAQSVPVQLLNTNPFRDNTAENVGCKVSRQNGLPKNPRQIPTLKIVRPVSERLKRSGSESERRVTFTSDFPNSKSPPPDDNEDPVEELNLMMKKLNLGSPKYKIVNGGKPHIFCVLEVGSDKFYSYPSEAADEVEAARLAATSALSALDQLSGPPTRMKVTTDREAIQQRLIAIVEMHTAGVYMDKLSVYYTDKHDETLPPDWRDIVAQCSELVLNNLAQKTLFVIHRKNLNPSIIPATNTNPFSTSFNITIPPLVLPSNQLFPIYVSHVSSVSDIFVRSLGNENNKENFYKMSQKMNRHYSTITEPSPSIDLQDYYVIKVDDECLRIRVENYDPVTNDADVFFIDTGEKDTISSLELYPLEPQYSTIPAQAIRVSLFTTEKLAICNTTTDITEKFLLNRTFYLETLSREKNDISHVVVGILYDTSDENVQVNDLIIQDVCKKMNSLRLDGRLAIGGQVIEVLLSHIEYNGYVYLQSKNDGLMILNTMLNSLLESIVGDQEKMKNAQLLSSRLKLDPKEIYLAQRSDNSWVRVQVAFPSVNNAKMRMVDYGQILEVDRNKLLKLKTLSETVARFPIQAAQVELHNINKMNFTEKMATRLRQLAPLDEPLLCKVIRACGCHRNAVVELFKRSQPDKLLISINNTLELDSELVKNEDRNNNVKVKKTLGKTYSRGISVDDSLKTLRPPTIPRVSEFFKVHVSNSAANPGNFVVQPFIDKMKLKFMMEKMQNTYGNMIESLRVDSPTEKKFYAAKNHDGIWYRACINKVIDEDSVAVYLCDFGNIAIISRRQLQVLKKEFYELPQQAIKARLVGVKPNNTDWSTQDCVRFQQLVVNKDFEARVMTLESDNFLPTGLVLGLDLIDVSKDENVHIHEIFIKEKRAVPEEQ